MKCQSLPSINLNWQKTSKDTHNDWTIYYLRKKAFKRKIEKEELALAIIKFQSKKEGTIITWRRG